jgi:hypothetical protein
MATNSGYYEADVDLARFTVYDERETSPQYTNAIVMC